MYVYGVTQFRVVFIIVHIVDYNEDYLELCYTVYIHTFVRILFIVYTRDSLKLVRAYVLVFYILF
jgi:hypothetical protein